MCPLPTLAIHGSGSVRDNDPVENKGLADLRPFDPIMLVFHQDRGKARAEDQLVHFSIIAPVVRVEVWK